MTATSRVDLRFCMFRCDGKGDLDLDAVLLLKNFCRLTITIHSQCNRLDVKQGFVGVKTFDLILKANFILNVKILSPCHCTSQLISSNDFMFSVVLSFLLIRASNCEELPFLKLAFRKNAFANKKVMAL